MRNTVAKKLRKYARQATAQLLAERFEEVSVTPRRWFKIYCRACKFLADHDIFHVSRETIKRVSKRGGMKTIVRES